LWVETAGADDREVRVMVGGKKDQDAEKLLAAQSKLAKGDKEEARTWISQAEKLVGQIKAAGRKLLPLLVKKKKTAAEATQIGKLKQELEQQQEELKEPLQKIQETIGSTCALAGSCFVAGTPVHTPRGTAPIEKLALGRRV
jgi:hypothetical protein